jgi:hypothetical protein
LVEVPVAAAVPDPEIPAADGETTRPTETS